MLIVSCLYDRAHSLMRRRLREYFLQRRHVRVEQRANMITLQMSNALQTEVTLFCYGEWLSRISFLRDMRTARRFDRSPLAPHACDMPRPLLA